VRREPPHTRYRLSCLNSAVRFFREHVRNRDLTLETLCVACLNFDYRCVGLLSFQGNEALVLLPLRTIIQEVLSLDTAGIVLAHNHPSGDARPSSHDIRVTRRLASVFDALDYAVFDHLIFAGDECTSFRALGLL